jgi:hypothetical protein
MYQEGQQKQQQPRLNQMPMYQDRPIPQSKGQKEELQYIPEAGNNMLRSAFESRSTPISYREDMSMSKSKQNQMRHSFNPNKINKGDVDYDFSYNATINFKKQEPRDKYEETLERINEAVYLDGNVSLEPRLQEYLRKKIYYKREGIEPQIQLSQTYQITPKDRMAMKNFLNGKKNIYAKGNYNVNNQNNLPNPENNKPEKFVFLADKLKYDKRVPKLDYSPNKYRNVQNIQTMGMFGEEVVWNNNVDIIDSRDFIIQTKDDKYRNAAANGISGGSSNNTNTNTNFNNVNSGINSDRYKMASMMFNRSSRT